MSKHPLPINERYGVTVQVAAQFSGISRSRIYELLAAGELEGKVIHGRRIVVVRSLLRMCRSSNKRRAPAIYLQSLSAPADHPGRERKAGNTSSATS